jgi:hypothetical protein
MLLLIFRAALACRVPGQAVGNFDLVGLMRRSFQLANSYIAPTNSQSIPYITTSGDFYPDSKRL